MKKFLLAIVFMTLAHWGFSSPKVLIPLSEGWEFRQVGKDVWQPAEVPGVVHTDLYRNGDIPNPFFCDGEHELEWIENEDWEYRTIIDIPQLFSFRHAELVFEGLDTYADVFLNDHLLLSSDNMFMSWEQDIKPYLKTGPNELRVRFRSPIMETAGTRMMYPYPLPADNDAGDSKASIFVRKAPIQFGWDMAPRFVSMGIWKPVYIRVWDDATIRDMQFRTLYLGKDLALVDGLAFVEGEEEGKDGIKGRESLTELTIKVQGNPVWDTSFVTEGREQVIPFLLTIPSPKRWWPQGYGDPNLYQITATIGKRGKLDDSLKVAYGLRTIELEQETDATGTSFTFVVNGKPIYAKGAGYIPEDIFPSRAKPKQEQLRKYMLEANFNMVRLWGGGGYQTDEFYNWCDENGILVWQDLMFACAMYPHGPDFHNRVTDELEEVFLRLRNHPSIALWCGNNEIEVAWNNWGWQDKMGYAPMDSFNLWEGYQELFHEIIPSMIERYDPDRPYISSTPMSNWGTPENFTRHDNHYWGVWHGEDDLDGFRDNVPRFMSEFGMQSFPVMESLAPYAREGDLELGSAWMENRQKSYKGNDFLFSFTERWLGTPKDTRSALLMSQVTQAIALEIAIEAQRSRAPFCMGTLYWQLNDCWPGPSWSSIDYEGRPKAAHYALKRLFADQLVGLEITKEGIKEFVVDDTRVLHGKVKLNLKTLDGDDIDQEIWELEEAEEESDPEGKAEQKGKTEQKSKANQKVQPQQTKQPQQAKQAAQIVASRSIKSTKSLKQIQKGKAVAFLTFENEAGDTLAYNIVHALPLKKLKLKQPVYNTSARKVAGGYVLKISSNTFVKSTRLEIKGEDAAFSDQFFDLFPNHPHQIMVETDLNISENDFLAKMKIESLVDWRE